MMIRRLRNLGHGMARYLLNDLPTRLVNSSYNAYSMFYRGQISLGLPVSQELIVSQEEIQSRAVGKLALALFHVLVKSAQVRIPREEIKLVIMDELEKGQLRLTEKVILLSEADLKRLVLKRLKVAQRHMPSILKVAQRRRILKTSFRMDRARWPVYFESEIEEKHQNERGDYEIVYYRDFTDEGKDIGFRRLVSMEAVTAGDEQPNIILVPGFACNSNCFNMDSSHSLAKDLADKGFWVYLFDPRGVGVNKGRLDPLYTVDSLIDYDLPTVVRFIHQRSHGKPSVLLGHSMGGLVAENMVLNWSLRRHLDKISDLEPEQKKVLTRVLPSLPEAENHLQMVRGIITLASPKFFEKRSHLFFPTVLWLNHISRIFRFRQVPIEEISKVVAELPIFKQITRFVLNHDVGELNFLIAPENHRNDKFFIERYIKLAMESIPLGLGFQCLKAIYGGKGFKRMDDSHLNYSETIGFFPDHIPVFHFWGTRDHLASLENLRYRELYPHRIKKIYHLASAGDLNKVRIEPESSQLIDFIVEGANHLDLLYGKAADAIVAPLLQQIIEKVWHNWSYEPGYKKTG